MKMALFTFAFLIAGSSFARAEMVAVQDPARVRDYVATLHLAAYTTPMYCTDMRGFVLETGVVTEYFLGADQAWVDKSASPPEILLVSNTGLRSRILSRIKTSSDHSQILSIRIELQSFGRVNTSSSLLDPVFKEQFESYWTWDCVRRK